ncbi:HTH-type transcriptional regulator CdhR [bioreactor metagenome]|uniref:HTH-type transcriptional regulator CdhR n=1 Tax=bioreactor metagenome TaxID=1076179 RepID=A0A645IGL4_9ZZZZ
MGEVIGRIEREFTGRITLAELARSAHVSPNHLLRLFKTATGSTPGDYLLRVRLGHAAKLLRQSALSIGEIAEASGFPDSNYFSRKFRAHYGQSPRVYRKAAMQDG